MQERPPVTDEHKAIFYAPYTKEEIKKALFSISGNKSLGTDGFGTYFYIDAWIIVGNEVIEAVLNALQEGRI